MRSYMHHVGDYIAATAHLTETEDLAYRRMLDVYYLDEKPLETDPVRIGYRIRMQGDEKVASIRSVLDQFFELRDDGWHQKRADDEIEKFVRRVANARVNGKKGGRPPKKVRAKPRSKPKENRVGSEQKPEPLLTNNHEPQVFPISPNGDIGRSAPLPAASTASNDDKDTVFRLGVMFLVEQGHKESNVRSMLGKLCSDHGDAAVAKAVRLMATTRPVEAVAWLQRAVPAIAQGTKRAAPGSAAAAVSALTGGLLQGGAINAG
jgi:uncharacterized protein YdaU (DUF1376 family)